MTGRLVSDWLAPVLIIRVTLTSLLWLWLGLSCGWAASVYGACTWLARFVAIRQVGRWLLGPPPRAAYTSSSTITFKPIVSVAVVPLSVCIPHIRAAIVQYLCRVTGPVSVQVIT